MPEFICPQCETLFQIPPSAVLSANFCSRTCYENSRKITKQCSHCGSIMGMRRRDLHIRLLRSKSGKLFCSDSCQKEWLKTIPKKGKPRKERLCLTCGISFHSSHPRAYCSTDCARSALSSKRRGPHNPNWVEKIIVACESCGKKFESYRTKPKRFCSRDCWANSWKITPENRAKMLKALHARPTKPEQLLSEIILRYAFPFQYVGDGSFLIGKLNPDFISTNENKKIIEFFGDFWHSEDSVLNGNYRTENKRREYLMERGYDLLIIRENDFQDTRELIDKISAFSTN